MAWLMYLSSQIMERYESRLGKEGTRSSIYHSFSHFGCRRVIGRQRVFGSIHFMTLSQTRKNVSKMVVISSGPGMASPLTICGCLRITAPFPMAWRFKPFLVSKEDVSWSPFPSYSSLYVPLWDPCVHVDFRSWWFPFSFPYCLFYPCFVCKKNERNGHVAHNGNNGNS